MEVTHFKCWLQAGRALHERNDNVLLQAGNVSVSLIKKIVLNNIMSRIIFNLFVTLFAGCAYASVDHGHRIDLTYHFVGYLAIALFVFALTMVMIEERIHLRKSKPVMLAAGLIWASIAFMYNRILDLFCFIHTGHY